MSQTHSFQTAGRQQGGFTLLEIMIAVGILSSITVLTWGSFQQTFRTKRTVEASTIRYRTARVAMDRILRDVQMAYLSKNVVPGTEQIPRTFFDGTAKADIDELHFTYFGHQRLYAESKEGDTAAVGYYGLRDREKPRQMNLWRRETRRIQTERFENIGGEAEMLCDDVVRLQLQYYHPDRKAWLDTWHTTQADGFPDRLPTKVLVRLVIHDENGKELEFSSESRLTMLQPLDTSPRRAQ